MRTKLIIASTRPTRKGPIVAAWIALVAREQPEIELEVLDLATINLPMMDEPQHPRLQKYQHQHTKDWSAKIEPAEAFIIVMPEYNFGYPAPLKNAIDYLFREWNNKPVGLVSYGGVSAGLRAVQSLKPVLTAIGLVPVPEAVSIPMFTQFINDDEQFVPNEPLTQSAQAMMKSLVRWSGVLNGLREKIGEGVL
ncbi:MAG: NAD(P)H-dependent oxidoreductase [Saprospiraceae bacterium]